LRPAKRAEDNADFGQSNYGPSGGYRNEPMRAPPRAVEERQTAGRRPTKTGMAKVYFGIGRDSGVAARDLVGAITGEAGIPTRNIGAIDLTDRFALVEVPSELADYVIEAMQGTRIRGRKVNVRADRPPVGGPNTEQSEG